MRKYIVISILVVCIIVGWVLWDVKTDKTIAGYSCYEQLTMVRDRQHITHVFTKKLEQQKDKEKWLGSINDLMMALGAKKVSNIEAERDWVSIYLHDKSLVVARINKPNEKTIPGYQVSCFLDDKDNLEKDPGRYTAISNNDTQMEVIIWYPLKSLGNNYIEIYRGREVNGSLDFRSPETIYKGMLELR